MLCYAYYAYACCPIHARIRSPIQWTCILLFPLRSPCASICMLPYAICCIPLCQAVSSFIKISFRVVSHFQKALPSLLIESSTPENYISPSKYHLASCPSSHRHHLPSSKPLPQTPLSCNEPRSYTALVIPTLYSCKLVARVLSICATLDRYSSRAAASKLAIVCGQRGMSKRDPGDYTVSRHFEFCYPRDALGL